MVEVYLYEKQIRTGEDRTIFERKSSGSKTGEEGERKMKDEKAKFLMLTFAEHVKDQAESNKLFYSVKKLSYSISKTRSALKYVRGGAHGERSDSLPCFIFQFAI